MATTTSSNCTAFFRTRPNHVEPRVRPPSTHGCAKLDGVAMWLMNGVANAFFASLQRYSCIRIATVDDHEDSNDLPLIFNDGNLLHDGGDAVAAGGPSSRRKEAKERKR
ncbi:hypothetical protein L1987_64173 [Smallanthus sonchifolius]|uniref:Uncharacterized protein n=1 Tax=Smallanthus sonchifolius TaxID=185202 RepID=A0ACB9CFD8_9ASTR|nr:hypothetical protein L1987_64173 [Smallanthus sonchifolius]